MIRDKMEQSVIGIVDGLRAENKRYRRALEWYANMDNYFCQSLPHYEYADPLVVQDWGERARAALTPPAANESENADD